MTAEQEIIDRLEENNALAWQMVGWLRQCLAKHIGQEAAEAERDEAKATLQPQVLADYAKVRKGRRHDS